jgi:hypothetical protein
MFLNYLIFKGEVNSICIEIEPIKSNTNIVKIKTTNDIAHSNWILHQDPKFVTDQNLALIVRKMALHADLAYKVWRGQGEKNLYGGKWYERLKYINRIKKACKDYYAKKSSTSTLSSSASSKAPGTDQVNEATGTQEENQLDFTDFI